ncbi:CsgG/HfaB family protein [Rubellicoccus peritrichatus]|uniref:CsgG/HfaB family protein n=1 Tax=Rubellicoccus peritrichatus TaxID=3080537 RepID=A0AAQ3L8X4_9BACT|nr:CsgG/HfaB family protein [Puniceicoccus sp. CR14]WOO41510.1 CsgG/HfaB family protein [Puniceicoccus sp. CR14]
MKRTILLPVLSCLLIAGVAQAAKKTLAVSAVVAPPALLQAVSQQGSNLALGRIMDSLDVQLLQALNETAKFTVVERQNLQPIIEEQSFGDSGNVDTDTAAGPFQLTGADYLLVVGIDDFQDFVDRATFDEVSREIERRNVRIAAVARIYDTTSGALKDSVSVELDEMDTQEYFTFGQRSGDTTEAIYRTIATVMADQIANGLADSLYPPRVLAKTGRQITINRGEGTGIEPGQTWIVFAVGEELIDPDTGENLGQEEIMLGSAEIVRVSARTAQAMLTDDNGVQKGQVIRPQ